MAKKCKPFRVAVIGCSGEAEKHIAALIAAPETKLVAFCDVDKRLVKEYPLILSGRSLTASHDGLKVSPPNGSKPVISSFFIIFSQALVLVRLYHKKLKNANTKLNFFTAECSLARHRWKNVRPPRC